MKLRALFFIMFLMVVLPRLQAQDAYPIITADNAAQLQEIARYGDGLFTSTLAWSPDGDTLAVGGTLGVWLYDAHDLDTEPTLIETNNAIHHLAFMPTDNGSIIYLSGRSVYRLDLALNETHLITDTASTFALRDDGRQLATALQNQVTIWDTSTWTQQTVLEILDQPSEILGLEFNTTRDLLFARWEYVEDYCTHGAVFHGVYVWDLNAQPPRGAQAVDVFGLDSFINHYVGNLSLSPDGTLLALRAFEDNEGISLLDTDSTELLRVIGDDYAAADFVFSPDGSLLASREYSATSTELWDTQSGELVASIPMNGNVIFSPNMRQIAVGTTIWDIATQEFIKAFHSTYYTYKLNQRLILEYGRETPPRLFNLLTGETHAILQSGDSPVQSALFSPDGHWLITSHEDYSARLWNVANGALQILLTEARLSGSRFVFSPDSQLLLTPTHPTPSQTFTLWDVQQGVEIAFDANSELVFRTIAPFFTPDSAVLLSGASQVHFWYPFTNVVEPKFALSGESVTFSPNWVYAAYASTEQAVDDGVTVINVATGEQLAVIDTSYAFYVTEVSFSADSSQVWYTTQDADGQCSITDHAWDIVTQTEVERLPLPVNPVTNADGTITISEDNDTMRLLETVTGAELITFVGGVARFSDDGTLLVISQLGRLRVYGLPAH